LSPTRIGTTSRKRPTCRRAKLEPSGLPKIPFQGVTFFTSGNAGRGVNSSSDSVPSFRHSSKVFAHADCLMSSSDCSCGLQLLILFTRNSFSTLLHGPPARPNRTESTPT
jgi:hypothetical protein